MSSNKPDIVIIGAGPAGLMASISAAQQGASVTLCEALPQPGRRLLATGGGRCNLTNVLSLDDFVARFGRTGRFMISALKAFGRDALLEFMAAQGVPCSCPDGFHYFPNSQKAGDILQALGRILQKEGIRLRMNTRAESLLITDSRIAGVTTSGGRIEAAAVILAAGGLSYPELGGSPAGLALARHAGHEIIPPVSALVGLITRETWPGECTGIVLPAVEVRIEDPSFRRESWKADLLFTHHGISGPPILDLSGRVARLLLNQPEVGLRLNLTPDIPAGDWVARALDWQQAHGRRTVRNLLAEHVPQKVAATACEQAGIDPFLTASRLPAACRDRLANWLTSAPVTVVNTEGMGRAMATSGGVSLKQVNPATLESRIVQGLHFAGEVLDLDGPCGGFNLQWAFSSGWLAGHSAATR